VQGARVQSARVQGAKVQGARALGLCAFIAVSILLCTSPAGAMLTDAPRLAAIYDAILDAQFDQAQNLLSRACPPAPAGACQALALESLWWQIQIDPQSEALDDRFDDLARATIAGNAAWTQREPQRAEAWFYLAGSYAPRVQFRILRGQHLGAIRDGKAINDALERALQLDPAMDDAHFGIGLYHYYAGVAPAAAKVLRFLLMLPGGDRAAGLREMLQARDRGELLRGEAAFQLHLVYLWYEHDTGAALDLLRDLDARYPHNPLFAERIAEARDTYLRDSTGSAAEWNTLLTRAEASRVYEPRIAEVRARLGLAAEFSSLHRTADAIAQLQRVVDMHPVAPAGAAARAERDLRAALAEASRR
jgi:hypothetical protein